MNAFLEPINNYISDIYDPIIRRICEDMIDTYPEFLMWPGGFSRHHTEEGGLARHTWEVMEAAFNLATSEFLNVDFDVLLCAALYHDIGKIFDYKIITDSDKVRWKNATHKEKIGHLSTSYAIFWQMAHKHDLEEKFVDIAHCILSHHGRKEWGSPQLPQSLEANILHFADMISMMNDSKDFKNEHK